MEVSLRYAVWFRPSLLLENGELSKMSLQRCIDHFGSQRDDKLPEKEDNGAKLAQTIGVIFASVLVPTLFYGARRHFGR